jgi:hypothetical protein
MSTSKISLPITVKYVSTSPIQSLATDPEFLDLIAPCGFDGKTAQNMNLKYIVKIEVGWLKWTGYQPSYDGTTSFPCPLTKNQLKQFLGTSGAPSGQGAKA